MGCAATRTANRNRTSRGATRREQSELPRRTGPGAARFPHVTPVNASCPPHPTPCPNPNPSNIDQGGGEPPRRAARARPVARFGAVTVIQTGDARR